MRKFFFSLLFIFANGARAQAPGWRLDLTRLPPAFAQILRAEDSNLDKKTYTLDAVDEKLRLLQKNSSVERASVVEGPNGSLILEVRLAREVGVVSFKGISAISEGNIRSFWGIREGQTYETENLVEAAERLRLLYKDSGFLNPIIDVETPEDPPGKINLNVTIKEGPRTTIRGWKVVSPNSALNQRLGAILERKFDGPYTDLKLQEAQKFVTDYARQQYLLRAEISGPTTEFSADEGSAWITIRMDRVESYSVDFRGNKQTSGDLLETTVLDLKHFATQNPSVGAELADKIRLSYLQKGYARVEVTVEEADGSVPFSRRLIFNINEGAVIRLENIEVKGRMSRESRYYADYIRKNSSKLISQGFYNKEDLETGFKNLNIELQNQGYLISKIISTRTQYNRDRTKISLFVNLDEGPLTLVEGVFFEGNQMIPSSELQELLKFNPGQPLQLNQILAAISTLKNYYQEHGYIEMQLLNEKESPVTYNEDNTRAKLLFRIEEGPQVRVTSILLDGNTFTKDRVILNELDIHEGDLLTPSKIDESVTRLQRTGYFGTVEIKTLEERTAVRDRTLIVKVSERDPGLFLVGAGATNENRLTVRGYTSIAYRNLYGTGRGVSLRLEGNYNIPLAYPESRVILGYLEPYLFNTRNRGRVNGTRSKQVINYDLTQVEELNQIKYSVERDFTTHVTGIWDVYSLGTYNTIYLNKSNNDSNLDIGSSILHLDLDYRDNPFNPNRGFISKFSVEYSSPKIGSTRIDEYWRETASATHYWSFWEPGWVWANSVRGGYLQSTGKGIDGGLPYDKVGFTVGGQSTLRGYHAGTSDVFPNSTDLGSDTYKLTTSATMGLVKSEVRFPLYGDFAGAVFYDGSSIKIDGLTFVDNYRDSAGVGFHYLTPVGPLNIEFAWKLDRRAGESPWNFHLSIGTF